MCARYTLTLDQARLVMAGVVHIFAFVPRYNIGPAQRTPVILKTLKGVECENFTWGYKSQWSNILHINAQAERIRQTREFQKLMNQRCLVPMDGFYEWKSDKSPVRFTRPKHGVFYVAGLWHENDPRQNENSLSASTVERDKGGLSNPMSFVLLTTAANASVKPIHDRMPLILREERP